MAVSNNKPDWFWTDDGQLICRVKIGPIRRQQDHPQPHTIYS
ncbi:hypothetical protein NTE_01888 [Candidatus Nitrososphaera evergladensis SR1]|uniref:Uncharacterized protein n=1 Tax=Candidatus Nitrososphaera evergladensis SR1 TaxID=1459636 RepID=A0A075MT22_9ARCH|nr:hypothetical protein NTE_01888 [Candidatus Nitrososphaera evergladensis SR1]